MECRLNKLDYFIGIREEEAQGDLVHTVSLTIPQGLYAVFETPPATSFDFVQNIHRTWDYIANTWFKTCDYRRGSGPKFETYAEESHTYQEKIYIPIARKGESEDEEAECHV